MKTSKYPAMSMRELLKTKSYAVVRYIDGEYAYTYEFYTCEDYAEDKVKYMAELTGDDYRVVEVDHEDDDFKQLMSDRANLMSAFAITIDHINHECNLLINRNKNRSLATMTDADHMHYEHDAERFHALRNVLAVIRGATFPRDFGIELSDFPIPEFPIPDCTEFH